MRSILGKSCTLAALGLLFCALPQSIWAHPNLNGTWVLQPTQSNFAGEPVIQTGTVTINDRQHHIYINRNFNYDNSQGGFDYSFSTDGQVNSTIKNGTSFKSKAKWEGSDLVVHTTRDGVTTVERFSVNSDGVLMLTVDRPNHQRERLFLTRQ